MSVCEVFATDGSCERRGAGDQPRRAFANKAGERAASRPRDVHHSSVRITPVRHRRLLIDQYCLALLHRPPLLTRSADRAVS